MEQTASNPRRRSIGKQPGPPEIFPEIDFVETFDKLRFPVKVKNRNLRMDSYPRIYAVLGIMWEQDIAVIEGQPRLTLQEAMKDAKKWAVKERQHQQQVAKELQELGQEVDEDDMIGEIEFLVGRVTSKGLRKLSFARRFPKFLAKVKKLQMSEQRRFLAASVGLQQRLPAAVANGVLKYWWCRSSGLALYSERLSADATVMRECQLLLLGDIEAICRKQRQKGHRELQSGAAGGKVRPSSKCGRKNRICLHIDFIHTLNLYAVSGLHVLTSSVEVLAECILSDKEVEAMEVFEGPLNMSFLNCIRI